MNFCACGGLLDRGVCEVCGHDDWEEREAQARKAIAKIESDIHWETWVTMPVREERADPFGFNYNYRRGEREAGSEYRGYMNNKGF
jgi:hypothetical protein